jgi:hypothetical protein
VQNVTLVYVFSHIFGLISAPSELCPLPDFKEQAIALMMQAVQSSETLVSSNQSTRRYKPEGSHLHNHRRENHKSV